MADRLGTGKEISQAQDRMDTAIIGMRKLRQEPGQALDVQLPWSGALYLLAGVEIPGGKIKQARGYLSLLIVNIPGVLTEQSAG